MGRVASGHPTRFDEPEFLTDMIQGLGEICQELNASDGMSGATTKACSIRSA